MNILISVRRDKMLNDFHYGREDMIGFVITALFLIVLITCYSLTSAASQAGRITEQYEEEHADNY